VLIVGSVTRLWPVTRADATVECWPESAVWIS
jgi:hypothetical protein